MARKVIGMARNVASWRRRWLLSFVVVAGAVLALIPVLQAVHRDGVFELDGDVAAAPDTGCTAPFGANCGIDWENVAKNNAGAGVVHTGIVGDAPLAKGGDQSIFTTGGAKDDLDTTNWLWTTGSVPDKDEILDAYAARIGSTIYFGADRYITNGTAQMGFWFFQNAVGPVTNTDGSKTFGTAGHKVGDVLVLADFTNGGSAVTVRIYKWVGTGGDTNGTLQLILPLPDPGGGDPDPADCRDGTLGSGDDFCGTTNPAVINLLTGQTPASATPLWPYQAKSGAANVIPIGGFLEGGIDLVALGLGNTCFASFLAETRSSAEPGAQLKDFVHHSFQPCSSGIVTTPQASVNGTTFTDIGASGVSIDQDANGTGVVSVRDKAVVNFSGVQNFTGTAAFFLCGPTPLSDAAYTLCATGGTSVGTAAVSGTSPATVFSPAATVTSVGRYCWRGEFSTNIPGFETKIDATVGECFSVNPIQPGVTTVATPPGPVPLGTAVDDDANLTPTSTRPGSPIINGPVGAATAGTITFSLYGPSASPVCIDPGQNVTGNRIATRVVNVNGSGHYFASSGSGTGSLTPTAAGKYYWRAIYSGDGPNTLSTVLSACGETNEDVVISPNQPTITTDATADPPGGAPLGTAIDDVATLGNTFAPSNGVFGTITFSLYGPSATPICTTAIATRVVPVTGNGPYSASSGKGTGSLQPTQAGTYYWIAAYTPGAGDVNNLPVSGICGDPNEASLLVSTTISTSQFFFPNDSATITASGGGNLAGNVVFTAYSNAACTTVLYTSPAIDITTGTPAGPSLSKTVETSNTTARVTTSGVVYWVVNYTSTNAAHPNVSSPCGTEHSSLTITNQLP